MGGFCGVVSSGDCISDLFFGTDYHSHLGTHRGGMCVLGMNGFQRAIHNIQNAPFRSKFEHDVGRFSGKVGVGVISDTDPQPLVMCTKMGSYAIATVGYITNIDELKDELFRGNSAQLQYSTTSGMVGPTEVVSALIATQGTIVDGVRYVQQKIHGSCSILILSEDGRLYAARDRYGRTPIVIGKKQSGMIALMESCARCRISSTNMSVTLVRARWSRCRQTACGRLLSPVKKWRYVRSFGSITGIRHPATRGVTSRWRVIAAVQRWRSAIQSMQTRPVAFLIAAFPMRSAMLMRPVSSMRVRSLSTRRLGRVASCRQISVSARRWRR